MIHTEKLELIHVFVPRRDNDDGDEGRWRHEEPPVSKMVISGDDQWLAAVNCFGDIYIFNLETNK